MDVSPNKKTNFALQQQSYIRLKKPYSSNCYSNWSSTDYTDLLGKFLLHFVSTIFYKLFAKNLRHCIIFVSFKYFFSEFGTGDTYSRTVSKRIQKSPFSFNLLILNIFQQCQRFCLFSLIKEHCNCSHPAFLDYDKNSNGLEICGMESNSTGI